MWKTVTALGIFGIVLSLYLIFEQVTKSPFQPCNINSVVNCNAIISGSVSKTAGIPTPWYGLVGYIVIVIASLLRKKKLLLGTAIFGLLFCLWIAYQELALLHVICPVCLLCQFTMISVFVIAILLIQKTGGKR